MAAITSATLLYQSTDPGIRVCLIAVRKVTTNDTMDVSITPSALFSAVYSATHVCASNRAQAAAQPGVVGTVLTFNQASLASDALELLVVGEAPQ